MKKTYTKTNLLSYTFILFQLLFAFSLSTNAVALNNGESASASSNTITRRTTNSGFQLIRLEFNGIEGSLARRELLLGFSEMTSDGYDYGYDAKVIQTYDNDLNLDLDGMCLSMQAYAPLVPNKVVKLKHTSSGDHVFSIKITELENFDESQQIFIMDKFTGEYFDLSTGEAYQFTSSEGSFSERFEMGFQEETAALAAKSLSSKEAEYDTKNMFYASNSNTFYAKNLNDTIKRMVLVNMKGQTVAEYKNLTSNTLNSGIVFNNIATDAYAVMLQTESNTILTKKIVVN